MNDLHPNPFEPLEPPRGGLAQLRARIERDTVHRARTRWLQTTAAAVLVLGVAVWTALAPRSVDEPLPEFEMVRIGLGLAPRPTQTVSIDEKRRHELAARRVPLSTESVVFYRIASVQEQDDLQ